MQLITLILFWLFFGCLASYIANRRGKNPLIWFAIGLFLGVIGVVLAIFFPNRKAKKTKPSIAIKSKYRGEAWLKMWYYLDLKHVQQGPFEFPDFIKLHREERVNPHSLIWGEGMKEWKTLSELPELTQEIEAHL